MGPTAAGKTEVALALAERADVDLISVDSVMVYRRMDIGTAKPDTATLAGCPHALIDIREPTEAFSAADFLTAADAAVAQALSRGRLPVLVGGTMLYFRAFRDGLSELPPANEEVRAQIDERAADVGWPALHAELARIDPVAAEGIHPNNPQRIQRALEVFYVSGVPISHWWSVSAGAGVAERLDCDLVEFAVDVESREQLMAKIEARFEAMLGRGLIDEVERLRTVPGLDLGKPSMRAVGYRQVWRHLDGDFDYETMRENAVVATRQLAKRQMTWLKSWPALRHVSATPADAAGAILKLVR